MLFNTEGVVVRSTAYGETNAIITLLTPMGALAAMARGGKKPQSRLAAGIQLCAQGVYSIYQRSGMGTLQQVELLQSRRMIHERLELAAYAAYFCELVSVASEKYPDGHPAVFNAFTGALSRLEDAPEEAQITARIWETKILDVLGASPDWRVCVRCGDELTAPVWYSARDGGLVCANCGGRDSAGSSGAHTSLLPVLPTMPKLLHGFRVVPWQRLGQVNIKSSTSKLLSIVLRMQMQEFAGLSLKSRSVLDSLDMQ